MKQKDDYLWKGVLEDVLDDFLRFVHPNADQVLDLNKEITFLDKELEQLFPPEGDLYIPKWWINWPGFIPGKEKKNGYFCMSKCRMFTKTTSPKGCSPITIEYLMETNRIFEEAKQKLTGGNNTMGIDRFD